MTIYYLYTCICACTVTLNHTSGIGLGAPGEHGEGPRAAPDIPQGVSDGEHNSEEDEPLIIPDGKLLFEKYFFDTALEGHFLLVLIQSFWLFSVKWSIRF